jgi:hypothetical protein
LLPRTANDALVIALIIAVLGGVWSLGYSVFNLAANRLPDPSSFNGTDGHAILAFDVFVSLSILAWMLLLLRRVRESPPRWRRVAIATLVLTAIPLPPLSWGILLNGVAIFGLLAVATLLHFRPRGATSQA